LKKKKNEKKVVKRPKMFPNIEDLIVPRKEELIKVASSFFIFHPNLFYKSFTAVIYAKA
jgi:hypothetical protein